MFQSFRLQISIFVVVFLVVFSQAAGSGKISDDFLSKLKKITPGNTDSVNLPVNQFIHVISVKPSAENGLALYNAGVMLTEHDYDEAALKCLRASFRLVDNVFRPLTGS